MTCRERLKIEHPDCIDTKWEGGCLGCPSKYGYLTDPPYCSETCSVNSDICTKCWDREIPEEKELEYTKSVDISRDDVTKPRILDSGNRREFDTGAVRDIQEGKGRCDLMPLDVVGRYLEDGIFEDIAEFQKTGSVNHLYLVLWKFAPHWGSKEHMNVSNSTMLLEVSKHYEDGCKKYGERNWQKGIPIRCYIDSAVRHYLKFIRGDMDEPHDRAFVWNILGAIWTCIHKPELNEYVNKENPNE